MRENNCFLIDYVELFIRFIVRSVVFDNRGELLNIKSDNFSYIVMRKNIKF